MVAYVVCDDDDERGGQVGHGKGAGTEKNYRSEW